MQRMLQTNVNRSPLLPQHFGPHPLRAPEESETCDYVLLHDRRSGGLDFPVRLSTQLPSALCLVSLRQISTPAGREVGHVLWLTTQIAFQPCRLKHLAARKHRRYVNTQPVCLEHVSTRSVLCAAELR